MRLRWTRLALTDFEQAHDYIAQGNPEAARKIARCILDATEKLLANPFMGRVGEIDGSREWCIDDTPYILIYSVKDDVIELWRVWYTSRDPTER